jgi:phosphate/sulfate permease
VSGWVVGWVPGKEVCRRATYNATSCVLFESACGLLEYWEQVSQRVGEDITPMITMSFFSGAIACSL